MKLYLSSIRIPTPEEFAKLLGKSFKGATLALIPNAQDYYADRAWKYKVGNCVDYFKSLGFSVDVVDLRNFRESAELKKALQGHDVLWVMGGNTFCLRYEMHRSGFEEVINELLLQDDIGIRW